MKKLTDEDLARGWIDCPCGRQAQIVEPGMATVAAVAMCEECGMVGVQDEQIGD
jgi:hypothetical protein